ncbi:hypothetical protein [uncultured Fibrobacter sp.]|uniref:hypothetical protein n=1 Tax=uncultured Fibrobacter sp. TaxID=261512 RepID=UPI0025E4AA24|nr:hypothetical protein [uncultured Fibrobacter sp.]
MPSVISVPGFLGGSSKSDVMMDSPEELLNMFVEKKESSEPRGYTQKTLRSVEGERSVLEFPFDTRIGCRGLFTASDGTMFAAFDASVYRIRRKDDGSLEKILVADLMSRPTQVVFSETGGINSHVVWVDGSPFLFAYSLKDGTFRQFATPLRTYKSVDGNDSPSVGDTHATPTHVVCISGVICINDSENDTWYYTDPYVLGGATDERKVYRLVNGQVQYGPDSVTVLTDTVNIASEADNNVCYLWLDRYSLPKFQTAEYVADRITAMVLCNDRIYCFGTKSLQVYTPTMTEDAYGNSYSVFSSTGNNTRDNGAEIGSTVASLGGKVFWLGSSTIGDHSVWVSDGGAPVRISSNSIERELRGFVNISDAYGFAYAYNGHQFYVLTVPGSDKTYCYDVTTQEWFNRSTRDPQTGRDRYWAPSFATAAYGEIFLGSYSAEFLMQVDPDKFTDFRDNPIIKRRTSPVFVKDFAPFRLDAFWMEWNTGTTTQSYPVENGGYVSAFNPVAMLECSNDGGNTWGMERWAHGGKIGQYFWRTEWRGGFPCGGYQLPRMYVLRLTISDPVKVVITAAKMQITQTRRP